MRIEERIDKLERENRDLKRVLSLLLAGAVVTALVVAVAGSVAATIGLLIAAVAAVAVIESRHRAIPEVIRARKIEIVGSDGVTRVALGETVQGLGAVATYDSYGRFAVGLEGAAEPPGVELTVPETAPEPFAVSETTFPAGSARH